METRRRPESDDAKKRTLADEARTVPMEHRRVFDVLRRRARRRLAGDVQRGVLTRAQAENLFGATVRQHTQAPWQPAAGTPVNAVSLRRDAQRAGAELELGDGRAWVVLVGTVDAGRASAVADLVDELSSHGPLRRVSVDLTCTVIADGGAAAIIRALRAGAPSRIDITTAGVVGRMPEIRTPAALRRASDASPAH